MRFLAVVQNAMRGRREVDTDAEVDAGEDVGGISVFLFPMNSVTV